MAAFIDPLDPRVVLLLGAARVEGGETSQTAIQYADQGDDTQVYDQGQIILSGNKITYSSHYGIVLGPGLRDGALYGTSAAEPHPGPAAPLREVNTQNLVPGTVVKNNVIAFSGSGGIDIEGDVTPSGQANGSVAFARIVNNTIYGGRQTAVTPENTYLLANQWGGTWTDINESTPVDPDGTPPGPDDAYLDWAASAAEMLHYSGWGDVAGLNSSAAIFQYFKDHFSDEFGLASAGLDWWFDGQNDLANLQGLSQVTSPGGGFFPNLVDVNYVLQQNNVAQTMTLLDQYLRAGDACAVQLLDSTGTIIRTLTVWGFTYDAENPDYYTGLYVTDANWDPTNGRTYAPQLSYYDLTLAQVNNNATWELSDYSGSDPWRIVNSTAIVSRNPGIQQPVGIKVGPNASPTILNNIVADSATGILVDPTASTTVVGTTVTRATRNTRPEQRQQQHLPPVSPAQRSVVRRRRRRQLLSRRRLARSSTARWIRWSTGRT